MSARHLNVNLPERLRVTISKLAFEEAKPEGEIIRRILLTTLIDRDPTYINTWDEEEDLLYQLETKMNQIGI